MDDLLRAALYARVSSDRQADECTIHSQIAALQARLQADGLSFSSELSFLDDGYSGSTLLRPALERLRDIAYAGGLDRIYVHSPDRLARRYIDQALLLEEFRRHEVTVVFLNDIAPADSPEGNLLVQMQGMIAEYERAKILERTRRGRRFAARQGRVSVLGHAPFGYRYVPKSDAGEDARYQVIVDQAKLIQEMFTWVGVEGLSLGEVSRRLRERGIPSPMGKAIWDRGSVRGLLVNPAYMGTAKFGKTRLLPRQKDHPHAGDTPRNDRVARPTAETEQETIAVPALVSSELFGAVAEQLQQNRHRYRAQKTGNEFLLGGLLRCASCDSAYCGRRHRQGGKIYVYYGCLGSDRHRHGGVKKCSNGTLPGAAEEMIWSDVCALLREPDRLRREFERRLEQPLPDEAERERLRRELSQSKRRLARLLDAYEEGWIDKAEFEQRMGRAQEKVAAQEATLSEHQQSEQQAEHLRGIATDFHTFAATLIGELEGADFTTRRRLLRTLVKRIEVGEADLRIVYKVSLRPFAHRPPSEGFLQHCLKFQPALQAGRTSAESRTVI